MHVASATMHGTKAYRQQTSTTKTGLRTLLGADQQLNRPQQDAALANIRADVQALAAVRLRASLLLQVALQDHDAVDSIKPVVWAAVRAVTARQKRGDDEAVATAWQSMRAAGWQPQELSARQYRLTTPLVTRMDTDFKRNVDVALGRTAKVVRLSLKAAELQGTAVPASLRHPAAPPALHAVADLLDAVRRSSGLQALQLMAKAAHTAATFCSGRNSKCPTVPLLFPQPSPGPAFVRYSGSAWVELRVLVKSGLEPMASKASGRAVFQFIRGRKSFTAESVETDGVSASVLSVRGQHCAVGSGNLQHLYEAKRKRGHALKTKPFIPAHTTGGGITTATQVQLPADADVVAIDPGRLKVIHAVGLGQLGAINAFDIDGSADAAQLPPGDDHFVVHGDQRGADLVRRDRRHRAATGADAVFTALSRAPELRAASWDAAAAAVAIRAALLQDERLQRYYFGDDARYARLRHRHRNGERRHDHHVVRQLRHAAAHRRPRRFIPPTKLSVEHWSLRLVDKVAKHRFPRRAQMAEREEERRRLRWLRRTLRARRGAAATAKRARRRAVLRRLGAVKAQREEPEKVTAVVFGDYAWGSIAGRAPASHTRYMRAAARTRRVVVVLLDEWCTSVKCFRCGSRCRYEGRQAVCPNCADGHADRDEQGAYNIGKLFVLAQRYGVRPFPWLRDREAGGRRPVGYYDDLRRLCAVLDRERRRCEQEIRENLGGAGPARARHARLVAAQAAAQAPLNYLAW